MTHETRSSLGEEELILACLQSSFIQLKEPNLTSDEFRVDKYQFQNDNIQLQKTKKYQSANANTNQV
jgi:hypothetical protein